ncbi:MAG: regulatory protein RecX [Gemmatimonadota bacterium]|nr:regulatory protein RecX [Gemmatimonadota bacterium]
MPFITTIRSAKRRSGWIEIQLDGASRIVLPGDEATRLGLVEGQELEADEVERVRRRAELAEARRIALRYLSVRPRSRREVELRLRRAGIGTDAIASTATRMRELGYLDDRAFAAAFVRDRIRLKPSGARRLRSDLRARGVSAEDAELGIREAMAELRTAEEDLLERAAAKRARRLDRLEPERARRRLFAFLTRRGFEAADARRWIDRRWPPPEAGG